MKQQLLYRGLTLSTLIVSLLVYIQISGISRTNFDGFILLYTILFALYFFYFKQSIDNPKNVFIGVGAAILFRVALLFTIPNLSDDFYRFFWDGQLLTNGIGPFAATPAEWVANGGTATISALNNDLYSKLNSPEYFTIYPPVCQFVFWTAAKLFPNNLEGAVIVMKFFMLLFELGTLFFLSRMLKHWKLRPDLILLYALNPLVIIELTGNIHFEAGMICFSLMAVWLFVKKMPNGSALAMALAICTKLLPLIFLPFLIKRLFKNQSFIPMLKYFSIVGLIVVALFSMVLNVEEVKNILASIDLYFRRFEFNASVYYLIREIGYWVKGWNIIQSAGPILGVLTFGSICGLAFLEKKRSWVSLLRMMLLSLSIYLVFANIVHPWYIASLIAFCLFTNFRYPILWSFLIMLTYQTYQTTAYQENLWIVGIEYTLLLAFIVYELVCQQRTNEYMDNFCRIKQACGGNSSKTIHS